MRNRKRERGKMETNERLSLPKPLWLHTHTPSHTHSILIQSASFENTFLCVVCVHHFLFATRSICAKWGLETFQGKLFNFFLKFLRSEAAIIFQPFCFRNIQESKEQVLSVEQLLAMPFPAVCTVTDLLH